MLPDSTTDFEGSQGFFTYRIKPFLPVSEGEIVPNTAAIYFDYNDPVITNTATTYFTNLIITGIDENNSTTFSVYPNPANDRLTLLVSQKFGVSGSYEIFDLMGNAVLKGSFEKSNAVIYLPLISNGMYLLTVRDKSGYSENARFVICH